MRIGSEVRKRTGNGTRKSIGDETRKGIGEDPARETRNETHAALGKLGCRAWNKKALAAKVATEENGKRRAPLAGLEQL
jgi:hypothetical protein